MMTTLVVTKERVEGDTEEKEMEVITPWCTYINTANCTHNPPPTPENLTSVTEKI